MRRIGDRHFLLSWQVVRAATQPDPESTAWPIGDVFCRRYRHSHATPDHVVILEVCHIVHPGARDRWHVLVTSENWWDERRHVLRAQLWASHVAGSKQSVLEWMLKQGAAREGAPP